MICSPNIKNFYICKMYSFAFILNYNLVKCKPKFSCLLFCILYMRPTQWDKMSYFRPKLTWFFFFICRAVGHMTYGSTYRDQIVDKLRKAAEHCDCLQCFFIIHSMGGGKNRLFIYLYILKLLLGYSSPLCPVFKLGFFLVLREILVSIAEGFFWLI